jgi:hypothetical protein
VLVEQRRARRVERAAVRSASARSAGGARGEEVGVRETAEKRRTRRSSSLRSTSKPARGPSTSNGVAELASGRILPQLAHRGASRARRRSRGRGHRRGARDQTENDSPQPQVFDAFGLPNLKPRPIRLSSKSICVPFRYRKLFGSQTTAHAVDLGQLVDLAHLVVEAERVREARAAAALDARRAARSRSAVLVADDAPDLLDGAFGDRDHVRGLLVALGALLRTCSPRSRT